MSGCGGAGACGRDHECGRYRGWDADDELQPEEKKNFKIFLTPHNYMYLKHFVELAMKLFNGQLSFSKYINFVYFQRKLRFFLE